MIANKKSITLLIRVNLYALVILGIMYLLDKAFFHIYGYIIEMATKLVLLLIAIILPILISLYVEKTKRVSTYLLINIIPCFGLILGDWLSPCGDMCIRGFLSIAAVIYYVIMLAIFKILNHFIETE